MAFNDAYQWNSIWALAVGVTLAYYTLHLTQFEGPHFLQVGTAVISVLAMVLISFPYGPMEKVLDANNMWTPVIMNWITRALSLGCACAVACVFYIGLRLLLRFNEIIKETRTTQRFLNSADKSTE